MFLAVYTVPLLVTLAHIRVVTAAGHAPQIMILLLSCRSDRLNLSSFFTTNRTTHRNTERASVCVMCIKSLCTTDNEWT